MLTCLLFVCVCEAFVLSIFLRSCLVNCFTSVTYMCLKFVVGVLLLFKYGNVTIKILYADYIGIYIVYNEV